MIIVPIAAAKELTAFVSSVLNRLLVLLNHLLHCNSICPKSLEYLMKIIKK